MRRLHPQAVSGNVVQMEASSIPALNPSQKLLCGPGPTNVDPTVLEAMQKPMLGHLDPEMHDILLEVVDMLRRVYQMPDGLVVPLHCTGMAGMETGMANLLAKLEQIEARQLTLDVVEPAATA